MLVTRTAVFRDRVMAPRLDPKDVGQRVFVVWATPSFLYFSRPLYNRIKQSLPALGDNTEAPYRHGLTGLNAWISRRPEADERAGRTAMADHVSV